MEEKDYDLEFMSIILQMDVNELEDALREYDYGFAFTEKEFDNACADIKSLR